MANSQVFTGKNALHALLSASSAGRWLACPPSARLEEAMTESPPSIDARSGTLAHSIAEAKLAYAFDQISKRSYDQRMKALYEDELYHPTMDEYLDTFINYVTQIVHARNNPKIMLEKRLDYSRWAPGGFGTGDVVIVSDGQIDVIDLKYGKGVPVDAFENPQLRLYALGALNEFEKLFDIKMIRTHIVQPRLDSITNETLTVSELLQWADDVVVPAAKLAYEGKGEVQSGEHCRWCKARHTCRKYADDHLKAAQYDFREPQELSDDEIADIISQADRLAQWAKRIKEYAAEQAIHHGKRWPGWKLVAGKANRKISDEEAAIELLDIEGYPIWQTCSLRGIGELESLVGRKKLPEILGAVIVKPDGAPILVPDTDSRPAIDTAGEAQDEFKE